MDTPQIPWMHAKYAHIRIPKALLFNTLYADLSPEAILLYGAMMDRTSLSLRYGGNRYRTENGDVTIIYTQSEIMQLTKCRRDKARAVTHELSDSGLIQLRLSGRGKPYQIIVTPINWRDLEHTRRKAPTPPPDTPPYPCGDSAPSHAEISVPNNPDIYPSVSSNPSCLQDTLRYQLGYDDLIARYDPDLVAYILDIISDSAALSSRSTQQKVSSLDRRNMEYILQKLLKSWYTVTPTEDYILSALHESIQILQSGDVCTIP